MYYELEDIRLIEFHTLHLDQNRAQFVSKHH